MKKKKKKIAPGLLLFNGFQIIQPNPEQKKTHVATKSISTIPSEQSIRVPRGCTREKESAS